MRDAWHDIWGSAHGPVKQLSPQARILCGASVFTICLIVPVTTRLGISIAAITVALWTLLTRPPAKVARSILVLGLVLFLPYFLLTPLIFSESAINDWTEALSVPWHLSFRGITAMLATVSTITTLSASDLRQGLSRLPVPEVLSAILIQIVHQTTNLIYETRRVAQAVAVRGGATGYRTALKVISSLPRVWLPRVMDRAVRVADAMELRGYCQRDISPMGAVGYTLMDMIAIGVSLVSLLGVIALRLRGNL
jgi:energy-coupling factor transporter transmembrane protein EcfT